MSNKTVDRIEKIKQKIYILFLVVKNERELPDICSKYFIYIGDCIMKKIRKKFMSTVKDI